jgi:hypothetical protein
VPATPLRPRRQAVSGPVTPATIAARHTP